MHTANFGVKRRRLLAALVEVTLTLDFLTSNAMRLIPVQLRLSTGSTSVRPLFGLLSVPGIGLPDLSVFLVQMRHRSPFLAITHLFSANGLSTMCFSSSRQNL